MLLSASLKGAIYILMGSVCFATSGTLQALAPDGATPFVVSETRMILGTVFLFLWCLFTKKLPKITANFPWKSFLVCALWILFAQVFYFLGMSKIGVAIGVVIDIGTTPIATALFAWFLFKKAPSTIWYLATFVAIIGIILINALGTDTTTNPLYTLFPILGGACYAGYLTYNPQLPKELAPEASIMLVMAIVSVLLSPALFIFPTDWAYSSARGILIAVSLGIVTAGFAFTFVLTGLRYTSTIVASSLSLCEPMLSAALGIFFLHESASVYTVTGMILVLFSIVILLIGEAKKKEA